MHDRFDGTCPLTADHPGTELQWSEAWAGTSQVRSDMMTEALTQQRRGYRVYDESTVVAVGRRRGYRKTVPAVALTSINRHSPRVREGDRIAFIAS